MLDNSPLSHAIVSHTCRAIYFPIPKAGCSSIKGLLRRAEGLPAIDHLAHLHDRERSGLTYPHTVEMQDFHRILHATRDDPERGHYFRFTVTRNPFARLASAYLDKVAGKADDQGDQGQSIDRLRMALYRSTGRMRDALSFEDFVEALSLCRVRDMNRHWQHQVVLTCAGFVTFDWRIKLEELSVKMPRLLRKLHISDHDIGRFNVTGAGEKLSDLYSAGLVEAVRRIYARDFAAFRYDDKLPSNRADSGGVDD